MNYALADFSLQTGFLMRDAVTLHENVGPLQSEIKRANTMCL